jgi:hypothetical protein
VIGGLVLDVANFVGEAKALAVHHLSSWPTFDGSCRAIAGRGRASIATLL